MRQFSKMSDTEVVSAAIEASGLSVRKFAELVLVREERTVHRWLAGQHPVPKVVREALITQLAAADRVAAAKRES